MKQVKWYAIVDGDTNDILEEIEATSSEKALEKWLADLPGSDAEYYRHNETYAIPLNCISGHKIPAELVSAIEYGPEIAGLEPGTPEWEEYEKYAEELKGLTIVDWVRVDQIYDYWAPVVI